MCVIFFGLFMLLCVSPGPTQYIFHMPMARYSLYVLKVSLNTKQTNIIISWLCFTFCDCVSLFSLLYYYYRQDAAKRQPAGIVFT